MYFSSKLYYSDTGTVFECYTHQLLPEFRLELLSQPSYSDQTYK